MLAQPGESTEWALRERVKELTCLYGIARVAQQSDFPLDEALQRIVELLPPALQYPEVASAKIVFNGRVFATEHSLKPVHRQVADLIVSGIERGSVEFCYTAQLSSTSRPPFLEEEVALLEMAAREISFIIERRENESHKAQLQDQLRHADRLATIGQLAAGVAHEINEPLANILGFAQLAKKVPELPAQAIGDLEKIVKNCLHAREVINKLLTFARQMPPEKVRLNLNQIVSDGLYFVESRCAKAAVVIVRDLDADLPDIHADASQLHQVLVNLVVNAVQAMPDGGTLTISTRYTRDAALLLVKDTGTGMTDDVKKNIFTPFFTTKQVNQGTGLGLAVVHGIVASHGGVIRCASDVGRGTCFEISLPVADSADVADRGDT
ncbi:MAG TPA: ATP-binding protein [Terriglobales bacterium]|nr:ATP-binding protein [Terriglobales bacterium]